MSEQGNHSPKRLSRRKLLQTLGAAGTVMAVGSVAAALASDVQGAAPGAAGVDHASREGQGRQPSVPVYDVRHYGAKGDGTSDDTTAFERVLGEIRQNGFGTMYVPPGVYVITRALRLYRHTSIRMEDGAVLRKMGSPDSNLKLFVNGEIGNEQYAKGYEGNGGITVIGGTIDLCGNTHPPTDPNKNFQAFAIAHADGVHIERVRFINGHNGHIIELNSSRNVKLLHCVFQDQKVASSGQYEMVQIDFASKEAFPTFGAFDDTPCRDVLIEGCTFMNGHRGVGTHGSKYDASGKQVFHENIRIVNNHFKQIADIAIKPESYRNAVVSGNTIEQTGGAGIALYSCYNVLVSGNVLRDIGQHGIAVSRKSVSGVFEEPSVHIRVADNLIHTVKNSAIRVIAGDQITLSGNCSAASNREAVFISDTRRLALKENMLRGASLEKAGGYSAIRLEGCNGVEASGNYVSNDGYDKLYSYALYIPAGSTGAAVSGNRLASGASGTIRSDAPDTLIASEQGEKLLTGTLNATEGTIDLLDDITKYRSVVVATGAVSSGELRHETARGWLIGGFRPGTDFIHVATASGKFVAMIESGTRLRIVSASNPLRYIIGVT
ncbi:hypothetical protein PAESOLCIP111_02154 [Paenibacillus solanacearum]|uniref:Right handed beta helix domain-containing protein n=1 Tax=Paenibacillus solanacearum TaxID=2048548 RepID=A0A916JZZ8_9BACL|nr:right-handed parallel beta-helix repeat-containing protein [Paenibacillus solanacearum]CAG7618845.1 hypothetical protein PAESOLCIP111_02154 [Paenibacillus solanacearum]